MPLPLQSPGKQMQILPQGKLPRLFFLPAASSGKAERAVPAVSLPPLQPFAPGGGTRAPEAAGPAGTASAGRGPGKMAAAMVDPRGSEAAAEEAEESGSEWSSGLPEDSFSSEEEALEGDDEDEALCTVGENSAKSKAGTSTGWAEAMAKVLNRKVPESKPTILVKNKELDKEREKEKQEKLEKKIKLDKKREWEMMCRVKPDVAKDRDKERDLQRIATRGIVQLFNAVRKHQNNVDEKVKEAGSSNRKRAKLMSSVSKKDFIDVLRGMEGTKREQNIAKTTIKKKQGEVKSDEGPAWSILRDDFMMGASMKDWDKDSDQESDAAQGNRLRQDNESD